MVEAKNILNFRKLCLKKSLIVIIEVVVLKIEIMDPEIFLGKTKIYNQKC